MKYTTALIVIIVIINDTVGLAGWLQAPSTFLNSSYTDLLLQGWDFSIANKRTANLEKDLLVQELKVSEAEELFEKRQSERSEGEKRALLLVRVSISLIIIALILSGWIAVFAVVTRVKGDSFFEQYAATLTVSALTFIFPPIFFVLSWYEHYKKKTALILFVTRNIFVRLISIVVLVISEISARVEASDFFIIDCNGSNLCWETRLAQQLYSLVVLDTLLYIPITLFVFVRHYLGFVRDDHPIVKILPGWLWQYLSKPEFDSAGHVLRAVHVQTLCWMGLVCSPMLPLIAVISFLVMISLNGITVIYCDVRPSEAFRSSASSSMFMSAAAMGLALSTIPATLILTWLRPSLGCSPFRGLNYAQEAVVDAICSASTGVR